MSLTWLAAWGMMKKKRGRGLATPRELVLKNICDSLDKHPKPAKHGAYREQQFRQGLPPLLFLSHALHLLSTSLSYHKLMIMSSALSKKTFDFMRIYAFLQHQKRLMRLHEPFFYATLLRGRKVTPTGGRPRLYKSRGGDAQ